MGKAVDLVERSYGGGKGGEGCDFGIGKESVAEWIRYES